MSEEEKAKAKKELTRIRPDRVSIVDLSANGEPFFVVKNAEKTLENKNNENKDKNFLSSLASLVIEFNQDEEKSSKYFVDGDKNLLNVDALHNDVNELIQKQSPVKDTKEGDMAEKKSEETQEPTQKSESDQEADETQDSTTQASDTQEPTQKSEPDKKETKTEKGAPKVSKGRLDKFTSLMNDMNELYAELSGNDSQKEESTQKSVQNSELEELKKTVKSLTEKVTAQDNELAELKRTRKSAQGTNSDTSESNTREDDSLFGNIMPVHLRGTVSHV